MAKFSLDRNKDAVSDIKRNIENKKGELSKLEENKQALLDAATDIQGSDIDEEAQATIMELINQSLEENAEHGEQLSEEMNEDVQNLESMKQESQESMESNESERDKIEQKKALLDRIGLGGKLEDGIRELDDNHKQLEKFNEELIETEKELSEVSQKLSSL